MHDLPAKASAILNATALSKDDVVATPTIELAIYNLNESAGFFRRMIDSGGVEGGALARVTTYCDNGEMLAAKLADDYLEVIEFSGKSMPVHLAAADHLQVIAWQLREMHLNPEWKEYYDDMARKLDEYAEGLRIDPQSSFRGI